MNFLLIIVCLAILGSLLVSSCAQACTTIIIGRKRTDNSGILHAHIEDMGIKAAGKLWFSESEKRWEPYVNVPYVMVKQPSEAIAYWASGNSTGNGLGVSEQKLAYDDVLVGFNANGVALSCNWCYSREKNELQTGIRRYAMRQLLLEQASTARKGVELIGGWIDKYGQADWGGLSFQLSDDSEAWVVDTTSHQWVARKVRENEVACVANRFTIGDDFDICSKNLILHAKENGWYNGESKFNFAEVYSLPERRKVRYDYEREERVKTLLSSDKLTINNVLQAMEDRYEGTNLFKLPDNNQEVWEAESAKKNIPRPICTNLAQSFFAVSHSNPQHDDVFFIGLGTPGYSGVVPVFRNSTNVDEHFFANREGVSSAWDMFKKIQMHTDADFMKLAELEKKKWFDFNSQTVANAEKLAVISADLRLRREYTLERSKEIIVAAEESL